MNHNIRHIFSIFEKANYEIRLVGGCVRDSLLHKSINDYDFATNATPTQIIEVAKAHNIQYILTGIDHGTITLMVNKEAYEITTLRYDTNCDGRHANVLFGASWYEDALRRDFTCNAMSMDSSGNIYDYFGGQKHLQDELITFVGDAETRIQEDALRILRYFRFYDRYGAMIDEKDLNAIRNNLHLLHNLSGERIVSEFQKITKNQRFTYKSFDLMKTLGVFHELNLKVRNFNYVNNFPILMGQMIENIEYFNDTFKVSNEFRKISEFSNRNYSEKQTKDLLVDGKISFNDAKDYAKIKDFSLDDFDIPVFPISGKDLLNLGFKAGPEMGNILKSARKSWKEMNYTPTKNEMMNWIKALKP